ncbi:MAG: hypothetical protein ACLKAK_10020 [Alkaliphilus sp.]
MNQSKTYTVTVAETENKTHSGVLQEKKSLKTNDLKKQLEENLQVYNLTSISECLMVAMHEYDIERNKKQSFDNRAGIIITVFAAIGIAIYNKIPVAEIIEKMLQPLTFLMLLQIFLGCIVYLSLITSLFFAVQIIAVRSSENFDIMVINDEFISSAKINSVTKLLEIYLNLVRIRRSKNEMIVNKLIYSQWAMIISIVSIMVYLIIK